MPQDLPGFYYDAEKNRYFPIKGPIPGSNRIPSSSSSAARKPLSKPTQVTNSCGKQPGLRTLKLLQLRELYGKVIASNRGKINFKEEVQNIQASQPVVWKYQGIKKEGDGALEQTLINLNTPEGQTEATVLLTGGINGSLSLFGVRNVNHHFDFGEKCLPDRVWPSTQKNQAGCTKTPGDIWKLSGVTLLMPSNISCIKLFRKHFPFSVGDFSEIQHAVVSTLGSETSGGSVFVLNLVEPLDSNPSFPAIRRRIHEVVSLKCTIWTADCEPNGGRVVIGTNLGAASVDLRTGRESWMLRSKSDVFAQQIVHSRNVVLCGLRNGMIVTVDARERQEVSTRLVRHRIPYSPLGRNVGTTNKQWFKLIGNMYPSSTVTMPSSISSLVSLHYDDQYFLASSMDGSVLLYDHRLTQRGAVQSYEGHVNSHTHIQLGVDPTERFLVSGGEDCNLRLWSIKSGKLLFEEKIADSVPTTISWQRSTRFLGAGDECAKDYEEYNSGAWLGSQEGLFYVQSIT